MRNIVRTSARLCQQEDRITSLRMIIIIGTTDSFSLRSALTKCSGDCDGMPACLALVTDHPREVLWHVLHFHFMPDAYTWSEDSHEMRVEAELFERSSECRNGCRPTQDASAGSDCRVMICATAGNILRQSCNHSFLPSYANLLPTHAEMIGANALLKKLRHGG